MIKLLGFLMFFVAAATLAADKSVYDFTLNAIDGQPAPLAAYKGKVVLLVNVASRCGFTPQYAALEALYEKYKDRGLVIVGIPANNFGSQEPGSNQEIKTFCTTKYHVTFPMMAKISVKGGDQAPLYQYLTDKAAHPATGGAVVRPALVYGSPIWFSLEGKEETKPSLIRPLETIQNSCL